MVIAQISDIHITTDLKPVHEVDVVNNLKRVLEDIKNDGQVTHIVLTGDLCFLEGSIHTMEWVKDQLDAFGLPYYVIPGNHDDSVIMAQVFDLEHHLHSNEFYYHEQIDDRHLIFLDSSKGEFSVDLTSWLKAIDSLGTQPSLVFMHHPPVEAVPYMDANYALKDMKKIQDVLDGIKNCVAVFCGHYHVSKVVQYMGMPPVYICPSTFFQIDDRTETFKAGSREIGWQKISWRDDHLQVSVKWVLSSD